MKNKRRSFTNVSRDLILYCLMVFCELIVKIYVHKCRLLITRSNVTERMRDRAIVRERKRETWRERLLKKKTITFVCRFWSVVNKV